jgi:hypothetical protein
MADREVNIGLSLGADICWPIAYENLFEQVTRGFVLDGQRLDFKVERVTIEPFDLRQPVKYDVVIDRLSRATGMPSTSSTSQRPTASGGSLT